MHICSLTLAVRTVLDQVATIPETTDIQIQLCKEWVEWCKEEKRTFLKQRIESRLSALYVLCCIGLYCIVLYCIVLCVRCEHLFHVPSLFMQHEMLLAIPCCGIYADIAIIDTLSARDTMKHWIL